MNYTPWDNSHEPETVHRTDPTGRTVPISDGEFEADWAALKWWLCTVSSSVSVALVAWVIWG